MKKFMERVDVSVAGCRYVDLLVPERELYRGAGWFLAAVENGRIVAVREIDEGVSPEEMAAMFTGTVDLSAQGQRLLDWAGEREVYLGMMSCFQFCEPERFGADRLARVARLIVEQVVG